MHVVQCVRSDRDKCFSYARKCSQSPIFKDYKLHAHKGFEVFIFLRGKAHFIIEGNTYHIRPYDMLIIRNDELHQVMHEGSNVYDRIVLHITDKFFEKFHCAQYKKAFLDRQLGKGNLISAQNVKSSGMDMLLNRIEHYIAETKKGEDMVVGCAIVALLHTINHINTLDGEIEARNDNIKEIIQYINNNIASPLTLDEIAEKFYISKYHLCRIFKESTGFTVGNYIINKRILLTQELYRSGKKLSYACYEAGFGSYSNFYKAYVKVMGVSPQKSMLTQ